MEAKCSFWERDANSKAARHGRGGHIPLQRIPPSFPPLILQQDQVLGDFLQIHGLAQTWLPDVALAAVGKVHHLIFTDSRACRGLQWLLLSIKLMVCFLWISAPAGSLILLKGAVNTITRLVLNSLLFSLLCLGVSFRRAVEIRLGCYHSCPQGYAGTCFIKNIFPRFIIAIKFSPLAKTWH